MIVWGSIYNNTQNIRYLGTCLQELWKIIIDINYKVLLKVLGKTSINRHTCSWIEKISEVLSLDLSVESLEFQSKFQQGVSVDFGKLLLNIIWNIKGQAETKLFEEEKHCGETASIAYFIKL